MSYRSHSRGIMYTAPPSGDTDDRETETDEGAAVADEPTSELDHAATEANWTGTVSADD